MYRTAFSGRRHSATRARSNSPVRSRMDRARFQQRALKGGAKAGEAQLMLTRLDANEQIALVSALVLTAATAMIVFEPVSEQMEPNQHLSHVWKTSQLFLSITIALNLYAVANLALQHYYAKKTLWFNDGERNEHGDHKDSDQGKYAGVDCDTMVLFVKRTRKTRHRGAAVVVVVVSQHGLHTQQCL